MWALEQSERSLDAVRAERDPARTRRDCGDEPPFSRVCFDQQQ